MKLRRMVLAAALGATVLTTVPAVIAPHTAVADSCEDSNTSCEEEQDPEFPPGDPGDPGYPGDPGGGGDSGSGGDELTVLPPGDNLSDPSPAPADAVLPRVEVDGTATRPPSPMDPVTPPYSWSDSGGGGGGQTAIPYSKGQKWEEHTKCIRNNNTIQVKFNDTYKYDVTYQTSANISAKAGEILTATLGTQLNTTVSVSTSVDVTLDPGQSFTLGVEYQTTVYAITSFSYLSLAYTTEYVNVTAPTGLVTVRSC